MFGDPTKFHNDSGNGQKKSAMTWSNFNFRSTERFQPPNSDGRYDLMERVKYIVQNYDKRVKVVSEIYDCRGGDGVAKYELKAQFGNLAEKKIIDEYEYKKLMSEFGCW